MKKAGSVLILFLILTGCSPRVPQPPEAEFSGVIDIYYDEGAPKKFKRLRGNFRANGFKNNFIIIFSDSLGIPRSEIQVQNQKISYKGMQIAEKIPELFKYWPILFNPAGGKKTDSLTFSNIRIEYSDWNKTDKGTFPSAVTIFAPDFKISVEIKYGI